MFKNGWKKRFTEYVKRKKKFLIVLTIILLVIFFLKLPVKNNKTAAPAPTVRTTTVNVNRSFTFPALDNLGKATKNNIVFRIKSVEKTNQVLVKDQVFTAKNNKLFLIVNLELKNDVTSQLNIIPGDLVRLSIDPDKETRFAPDLHNNLVGVAAISTRIDRVGFVVPDKGRIFRLYIGEIEGNKQEISLSFPY